MRPARVAWRSGPTDVDLVRHCLGFGGFETLPYIGVEATWPRFGATGFYDSRSPDSRKGRSDDLPHEHPVLHAYHPPVRAVRLHKLPVGSALGDAALG